MSNFRLAFLLPLFACNNTEYLTDYEYDPDPELELLAVGPTGPVKTKWVPHIAPFSGSFNASIEPQMEVEKGWLAQIPVEIGDRILGGRAIVRHVMTTARLEICLNTPHVGDDPGSIGCLPVAMSPESQPNTITQLLTIQGQNIVVNGGSTYWFHITNLGQAGAVQLRGLQVDLAGTEPNSDYSVRYADVDR